MEGAPPELWALHGADCPLVWHIGLDGYNRDVANLARAMQDTWVSFVYDGKPGSAELPYWPQYSPDRQTIMVLDTPSFVTDNAEHAPHRQWHGAQWRPGTWWKH